MKLFRLTGLATANILFLCANVSLSVACSAEIKNPDQGYIFINSGGNDTSTDPDPTGQSTGSGGVIALAGGGNGATGKTGGAAARSSTGDICADITVSTSRATPWVLFVIDGSSSMNGSYGGANSRWDAIYQTLMAPNDGVIATLEGAAHFGILIYNGAAPCPTFPRVAPKLNNYKAIDAVYANTPTSQGTPTADALKEAYLMVPGQQQVLDNAGLKNAFVVLCTDGQPNSCPAEGVFGGMGNTDFEGPKAEVTSAAAKGIKTYVISVADANEGADYQAFLNEVAEIGNPGTPAFSPATKADLAKKIKDIVGAALSCDLEVKGKVSSTDACRGTVMLNSKKLECNGPDGWQLVDETHIRLSGKACTDFKGNAKIIFEATFPCGVVVVQ
jgi:hypothetical protein